MRNLNQPRFKRRSTTGSLARKLLCAGPAFWLLGILALKANPAWGDMAADLSAAEYCLAEGDVVRSEALLRRTLRTTKEDDPGRAAALLALAGVTEVEQSLELYAEVIRGWPGSTEAGRARLELARYRYATGAYWAALGQLAELRRGHPDFPDADLGQHLAGSTELALGRPDRALAAFGEGLALQPEPLVEAWLWIGSGDAHRASGRKEDAAAAYSHAIRGPAAAAPLARLALAEIEAERGNLSQARALYEQVAGESPGHYAAARRALVELERRGVVTTEEPAQPQPPEAPNQTDRDEKPPAVWAIQVGAFADQHKAEALAQRMLDAGHRTELATRRVGGKPFYRVLVGEYQSRDAAYQAGLDISDRMKVDFIPVSLRED